MGRWAIKTYVYVDGFNLYYGSVRNTPCRWLDISEMCRLLLPNNTISKIKYFTARVTARLNDPGQPTRQQTYLRALRTIPNLEIYYGHFLAHPVWMPLEVPNPAYQIHANKNPVYVRAVKTEEKGSDVNIASHLLKDAYENQFKVAVIVSNDSDLLTPIQIVRNDLKKPVGILNPHTKKASRALAKEASFVKPIRFGVIRASQFSPTLEDSVGTFTKPSGW